MDNYSVSKKRDLSIFKNSNKKKAIKFFFIKLK